MKRFILPGLLFTLGVLLFIAEAHATCPKVADNVACIEWKPPTQWSDSKPITGTITYTVFIDGKAYKQTTVTQFTTNGLASGMHTFTVTATVTPVPAGYSGTSDPSNSAAKTTKFVGPTAGAIEDSKPSKTP